MLNKHFMSIPIIKSAFKKGISWGELLSHFSFVICSLSATLIRPETTHYSVYILFCHFAGKSFLVSNLLSGPIFSFGSGHSLDPSLPAKTEQVNPSPYPLSHCRGQRHSPALQIATLESFYTFSFAFLLLYQIFRQGLIIFLLSAVVWFTPSSPSRFSWPITCYYNSFLVGLPDSSYSPTSQHSLAGISFHKYHLYHMHLYLKIGNGIKYEFFSLFSKSTQELFTTLLSQQPVPLPCSLPPSFLSFLSLHQPPFSCFTSEVSTQATPCLLCPLCDLLFPKLWSFANAFPSSWQYLLPIRLFIPCSIYF